MTKNWKYPKVVNVGILLTLETETMKIHNADNGWQYWYDRSQGGNWWAAQFDNQGNQLGGAVSHYTRGGILREIEIADKERRQA